MTEKQLEKLQGTITLCTFALITTIKATDQTVTQMERDVSREQSEDSVETLVELVEMAENLSNLEEVRDEKQASN